MYDIEQNENEQNGKVHEENEDNMAQSSQQSVQETGEDVDLPVDKGQVTDGMVGSADGDEKETPVDQSQVTDGMVGATDGDEKETPTQVLTEHEQGEAEN